jgi:polar amino acid transport system permease protein
VASTTRRRYRLTGLDLGLVGAVAAVILCLAWRADAVVKYRWNWALVGPYIVRYDEAQHRWVANLLLQGLLETIRLALWSGLFALIIGVVMGLCRLSRNLLLRWIARSYVELIRNIPPLVFIFVFYFFLTAQVTPYLGIDQFVRAASPGALATLDVLFGQPRFLPAVISAVACLALFEGAYVTEIVRAGVQSIEKGQWEAAGSIGMSRLLTLRLVILPQAIQRVVPPLAGQFISLVKDSSIVSLISIQELAFLGSEVSASTGRVFEVWITVSALYFVVCFGLSLAFGKLERHMGRGLLR